MTLPAPNSTSTFKQHPHKALRSKIPNALIPKQKIKNAMTRTFLKRKFTLNKGVSSDQRCIQTLVVSKETQQSSKFTEQQSIFL